MKDEKGGGGRSTLTTFKLLTIYSYVDESCPNERDSLTEKYCWKSQGTISGWMDDALVLNKLHELFRLGSILHHFLRTLWGSPLERVLAILTYSGALCFPLVPMEDTWEKDQQK